MNTIFIIPDKPFRRNADKGENHGNTVKEKIMETLIHILSWIWANAGDTIISFIGAYFVLGLACAIIIFICQIMLAFGLAIGVFFILTRFLPPEECAFIAAFVFIVVKVVLFLHKRTQ